MDTTYRLTQKGSEVQQDLNNAENDHTTLANHVGDSSIHVTPENKTAWNAKYDKPGSGIPKSDLASGVQTSLGKADTAYQKPGTGIPSSDMTSAVQTSLGKADSAYQKPGTGIPKSDMASAVQTSLGKADSAYQKPNSGIPQSDMDSSVQAKLNAAGSADQAINQERSDREAAVTAEASARQSADQNLQTQINAKANTSDMTTALNGKVDKVTGKGLSTNDYTDADKAKLGALPTNSELNTALAGKASTGDVAAKYTKPSGGIPKSDLSSGVQTSLGKADSAYQKPGTGIPKSDMASAVQTSLDKADNAAPQSTTYNKTEIDTKFDRVLFLERGLGKYDATRSITLQQATAGKYVNVNGQEVSASGYGISAEVQLNAGDIMLVPSASPVPADVSLFARIVTRTYDKVINYTYTYRQDYPELPATATADYNPALIYTAQYDESGDTPVLTGWAMGGQIYTTLPATRTVTESYYEPLMKQAVAAMPSTGYYVYLCPTSMTIVVSGYTATVSGGVALVVGLGIFKNIATNFIGAPGQAVIAQAFAQLLGEIEGLKAQLKNLGETRAICINSEDVPKVQNYPMIVYGAGAPSAPNVPAFIGQKYLDTTNKKEYTAFSVTNSVSDWVLLN